MGNVSSDESDSEKEKSPPTRRSAGDGQEQSSDDEPPSTTTSSAPPRASAKTSSASSTSGPPIPPGSLSKKQASVLYGENREPRFVPYEPYKAATKPIGGGKKIPAMPQRSRSPCPKVQLGVPQSSKKSPITTTTITVPDNEVEFDNEDKGEKRELEKQLEIQIEVNAELKKLLVASLGEDMENRVHFLTEDKLRLGKTIDNYHHSLTAENEEKDQLLLECERWKSKFLAASLMVDDLARWKASLAHHSADAREALGILLAERVQVKTQLESVLSILQGTSSSSKSGAVSLVDQCERIRVLLGAPEPNKTSEDDGNPGVVLGQEVLGQFPRMLATASSDTTDNLTRQLCGTARPYLKAAAGLSSSCQHHHHAEIGTRYENLTIACCEQCQGKEIDLV